MNVEHILNNDSIDSLVTCNVARSGKRRLNFDWLATMSVAGITTARCFLGVTFLTFPALSAKDFEAKEEVKITAEDRHLIQREINRRNTEKAIAKGDWQKADAFILQLEKDGYNQKLLAKLKVRIAKAKVEHEGSLKKVQKLYEAAKDIEGGYYSPIAIDLLDRALKILPHHTGSLRLRKKIDSYPYSLKVPEEVASIDEAVKMLRVGDTVELGEGVFRLSALLGKGVKIKGKGEKLTLVECDTTKRSAFTFTGGQQSYALSELTIQGLGYADDAIDRFPLIAVSSNLLMRNVTVKKGSGHGVAVVVGKLRVSECKFTGNAWDGVSVMGAGSFAELSTSDVSGNYDHGVDFWNGANGKLTNVTANSNSGSGVVIMGAGAKVKLVQVKAERNSQCGVVINSQANAKLEGVILSKNKLSGLVVQGLGTKIDCGIIESTGNGEVGYLIDRQSTVLNFNLVKGEKNTKGKVLWKTVVNPRKPEVDEMKPAPIKNLESVE